MKCFIFEFLIVLVLAAITQARYVEQNTQTKKQIALNCLETVGIDREVVENAMHTLVLPDNVKYKKFLNCSYKKQGYQSEDGTILYDNINKFLSKFYKKSDLKVLKQCRDVKGGTPEDNAFNALNCILEKLKTITAYKDD